MKLSRLIVGLTVILAGSLAANAAVTGAWSTAAAANNMTTWTLTLTSDGGNITSLDLKLTPPAGASFNQPLTGLADTLWQDDANDGLYTLANVTRGEDTYFLFGGVTSPGDLEETSTSVLKAAFTSFTPFAAQAVAQVAMANTVTDAPAVSSQDPTFPDFGIAVVGAAKETFIPEPATLALLAMGGVALIRRRR